MADNDPFPHCASWQCVAAVDIGKFPNLIVSRCDRFEERHPGHPGGTMETAMEVWHKRAQETAAEGVRYTPLGLHTALDVFYMI